MKVSELIELLENLKAEHGDVKIVIDEVENGNKASDRYGIGMGLQLIKEDGEKIEIKAMQEYVQTGCLW